MDPVCQLAWRDGVLRASGPGIPPREWTRPADLAAARLALLPPVAELTLEGGGDLLTAAFRVVPFVRGPLPEPAFGAGVTAAARAAFAVFTGAAAGGDDFRVLRGEPQEFLVCARRSGGVWTVGAFGVAPMTLTVRFEDLWHWLPGGLRRTEYAVNVVRDPHAKDAPEARAAGVVRQTLEGVAPDARICLDLARGGGFTLEFVPSREAES
ncbi:MAG: glycoside hydrolase family 97 C-terminal domain-containing protein [Kiritimatiellia bacterium]